MPKDYVPRIFVEIKIKHRIHISKQKLEIILYYIWIKINCNFSPLWELEGFAQLREMKMMNLISKPVPNMPALSMLLSHIKKSN